MAYEAITSSLSWSLFATMDTKNYERLGAVKLIEISGKSVDCRIIMKYVCDQNMLMIFDIERTIP